MIPATWMFRHDEIYCPRPYAFDVDEAGWLWEGCGANRLVGHNLRTNAVRIIPLAEPGHWPVYSVFAWQGKLVLILGNVPFYLVLDPATGKTVRHSIPAANPITWYGTKTACGKLLLCERSESKILVLDGPDAEARVVPCPYEAEVASGTPCSDGLVYITMTDPARLARFDPVRERYVDIKPGPFPESGISGRFEYEGVLYCADSSRGRLLPLELAKCRWLDPIPAPDYLKVYGFIGGGFGFGSQGYFCLSTYTARSRLDRKTGRVIVPEGPITMDGRPQPRFLDRMLVFDAATRKFDYLVAPAQPDGIPLLCYNWTDGKRFAITGIVLPYAEPGVPAGEEGAWLIVQNQPADLEPAFEKYDMAWSRDAHTRQYRRSYSYRKSLYLSEMPHTPPPVNMYGPAAHYPPEKDAALIRKAVRTDAGAYWGDLAGRLLAGVKSEAEKVKTIARFVNRALYYNPIQVPQTADPIAILESHDARCGHSVGVIRALLDAAGVESRSVSLNHHTVGEAFHDDGWHIVDALFFGADQPARDGRVLAVDELKADPYFADAFPQWCFAYDQELLTSEDGYQVLGYVFGQWGSEPYYSYYLFGPLQHPPTIPTILPAQRLPGNRVRLRWTEAVKFEGGKIDYDVRVCRDRACKEQVFQIATDRTSAEFAVPETNRMYFVEVKAMDDHRALNPNTWYPPARSNFVLVPPDQYGWYNVM